MPGDPWYDRYMSKLRFVTLALGFVVAGGACYVLAGQDRMQEVGAIAWMFVLTVWFYLKDWQVDSYGA